MGRQCLHLQFLIVAFLLSSALLIVPSDARKSTKKAVEEAVEEVDGMADEDEGSEKPAVSAGRAKNGKVSKEKITGNQAEEAPFPRKSKSVKKRKETKKTGEVEVETEGNEVKEPVSEKTQNDAKLEGTVSKVEAAEDGGEVSEKNIQSEEDPGEAKKKPVEGKLESNAVKEADGDAAESGDKEEAKEADGDAAESGDKEDAKEPKTKDREENADDEVEGTKKAVGFGTTKAVKATSTSDLASKTGIKKGATDIPADGACKKEVKDFCSELQSGVAVLANCITEVVRLEKSGDPVKDNQTVSDACKSETRAFKVEMYKDITMDKNLANICKEDIELHCDDDFLYPEPGNILACLRDSKQLGTLKESCKEQVLMAQIDAANDFKLDPQLNEVCSSEAEKYCKEVPPGAGLIQECLRNHRSSLPWDCLAELFRQEVENADDIRLNVKLFKACLGDKRKFCPDVVPGDARVKDCLEAHRLEPDFSSSCKVEFDKMMERRATDFRLDSTLRKFCKDDISDTCYPDAEDISDVASWDSKVIQCLQDYRDELHDPKCRQQVHQLTKRSAEDLRFDHPLANACKEDRDAFCKNIPNGHARVFLCLQESREKLKESCRSALFDQEMRYAEDIDFKFPMREACSEEMKRLCKDVGKGGGDVVKCLEEHLEDADMGKKCRAEIKRDELRSAEDYRLNFKLNKACFLDVQKFCLHTCDKQLDEGAMCGGRVLECLTENSRKLTSKACKEEVFYFEKREVADVQLDVPLQQACKEDIAKKCAETSKDHSTTLKCLREHRDDLSADCKAEELRFTTMEASDIRLTPTLMNACGQELHRFCRNVPPSEGRAFKCLQMSLDADGMGIGCRAEVSLQTARASEYYKLDAQLEKECSSDVKALCATADAGHEGHALVLKCLVKAFDDLSANCQSEVSYAVRMALWVYKPHQDLTSDCDDDVAKLCANQTQAVVPKGTGVYGLCLLDAKGRSQSCDALVRTIALEGGHVGGLIDDARLEETLLKLSKLIPQAKEKAHKGLVLKGWVAFVSVTALTAVLLGIGYAVYRKYFDPTRNYTLVVKAGDV